jgi:trans-aconitate 2-methyltransferase
MLADAATHAGEGVTFVDGDLGSWSANAAHDVVFSNAALHWAPDHAAVLERWTHALRPGGQLAVQVPTNAGHPAHQIAAETARERLGPGTPPDVADVNVLAPERYAEVLDGLGYEQQSVRLQVYCHHLPSTAAVVDWMKGSTLTRFRPLMTDVEFDDYVDEVRSRVVVALGDRSPFLYPFRRILLWGRRP